MADKTREVGVRLSVKDADVAARALQAFGAEGAQALTHIQAATLPANQSLVLLSEGIQRSKEYAGDFALEATRSFLGPIAAIGTAAGAIDLLREAMERVKQVGDEFSLAERLGIEVDKLQGLELTFKEMGGDAQELDAALQTFGSNLAKPNSPLQQLFKINGIKISGDVLTDLKSYGDLVKNAANQQAQLQIVTEGMGRGSKEVLDLLIADLDRASDRANQLGVSFKDVDGESIKETNEKLVDMNARLDDAKTRLALLIVPAETSALGQLADGFDRITADLKEISHGDLLPVLGFLASLAGGPGSGTAIQQGIDFMHQLAGGAASLAPTAGELGITVRGGANSALLGGQKLVGATVPVKGPTTKLPDQAAADAQKAIDNVTKALKLQIENLTETNRQQAINNALSQAHITLADKQGPAIAKLAGEYYDQKKAIDDVNQATSFLAQTGEQGFESLIDGTKSWQDALGDIVTTLEKAVLQAALLGSGPLSGILGTSPATSGQTGGAFGWLASLFTKSANGNVFTGLSGLGAYANSVVHQPTMFAFANGIGLMGEEPGSPGEAVMPLKRDSQGRLGVAGGGSVQVNLQVINNAGVSVTAEQSRDPSGGVNLKLMVEKIAATSLATPGAPLHRAARTAFGLVPQTTRRGA